MERVETNFENLPSRCSTCVRAWGGGHEERREQPSSSCGRREGGHPRRPWGARERQLHGRSKLTKSSVSFAPIRRVQPPLHSIHLFSHFKESINVPCGEPYHG